MWPLLQVINFKFVPLQYQVLYLSCGLFFWNIFLSHMANRKEKKEKQWCVCWLYSVCFVCLSSIHSRMLRGAKMCSIHSEMFRDVQRRSEMFKDVQRCSKTFRDVQRRSETFKDVQRCSKTLRDVQETKHFTQDGLVFWKKQFIPSFPSSLFRLSHSISTLTSPCSLHLIHGMHAHDSDLPSIASIKSLTRRTAPGAPALVVRSTSNTYLTSFLHSASYWTIASSLSTMRSTRPMR